MFRGYASDDELLNAPRADDAAPFEILRREIARLEPQKLYLPLGVGNHVDHQLCRDVGVQLLAEGRRWVMPGPEYAGIVTFYEDFPYAWWNDFSHLADLPRTAFADLPEGVKLAPEYADIGDQVERKITGINLYASQIDRLFGGTQEMARQVRAYGRKVALLDGSGSVAERYWSTARNVAGARARRAETQPLALLPPWVASFSGIRSGDSVAPPVPVPVIVV